MKRKKKEHKIKRKLNFVFKSFRFITFLHMHTLIKASFKSEKDVQLQEEEQNEEEVEELNVYNELVSVIIIIMVHVVLKAKRNVFQAIPKG